MKSETASSAEVSVSDRSFLRRKACLTQIQLARKTGISAPRICMWERGEIELNPAQVGTIAKVLHERLAKPPVFSDVAELLRALAPATGRSAGEKI
jgi:transcriptional regulator with XRE-family HTH domain